MSMATMITLGFLLGMRHATDPDHVVAVSTIVSRERSIKRAALLGVSWGLGHSTTVVLVGTAMVVFGLRLPARVGLGLELCVASMLVVLGVANVRAYRKLGASAVSAAPPEVPMRTRAGLLRSLGIGVVHGLAGSAAIALLVLATIPDPASALLYLLLFATGTIAGMVLITVALALPFVAARAAARLQSRLVWVTGLASILIGCGVAYEVVVNDGFLSAAPHWDPH